jgi:hypothetical protein
VNTRNTGDEMMSKYETELEWPHTTAPSSYHGDREGIDLFDEIDNGVLFVAIYLRNTDGTRWPARTVNTEHPKHAARVVGAWMRRGPVNDYRANPGNYEFRVERIADVTKRYEKRANTIRKTIRELKKTFSLFVVPGAIESLESQLQILKSRIKRIKSIKVGV